VQLVLPSKIRQIFSFFDFVIYWRWKLNMTISPTSSTAFALWRFRSPKPGNRKAAPARNFESLRASLELHHRSALARRFDSRFAERQCARLDFAGPVSLG
jgi:hypothetical protein